MNIFDLHQKFIHECHQEISTDSRIVTKDSLFFAWKGEKYDGNKYAKDALAKGCLYAVIDNPEYAESDQYILVPNSIKMLQDLAEYHREQFNIPVVAIGGSNGKTTTKELARSILHTQKNVIASIGSFNNHVGVPQTLLRINKRTDIVIVEIGANHLGEIKQLCTIARPTHGLITNIGRDHIGYFGGPGAILEANLELYEYLKEHGGEIFVNKDDSVLMSYLPPIPYICYGTSVEGEYGIRSHHTQPFVSYLWKHKTTKTQLTGEYNINNIAAAIALGVYFGIRDEYIRKGIASYIPIGNRSSLIITNKGNVVIKDFYNANRTSMECALENLASLKKHYPEKKSLVILGDMFELGDFSREEHQAVVDKAEGLVLDEIILVGKDFSATSFTQARTYSELEHLIVDLKKQPINNYIILLKASNGMNFQKLFDDLEW